MPHIHTQAGQHDMTTSAYIVRVDTPEPLVLLHMHRKFGKLLQIGGHIELHETPWQAMAHEILEESGYSLEELEILQPVSQPLTAQQSIIHPVPAFMNTHRIGDNHYHSDLCYAFVARSVPAQKPAIGESEDLRWLKLSTLQQLVADGTAAHDSATFYAYIIEHILPAYHPLPAAQFSLKEPSAPSL